MKSYQPLKAAGTIFFRNVGLECYPHPRRLSYTMHIQTQEDSVGNNVLSRGKESLEEKVGGIREELKVREGGKGDWTQTYYMHV